jgi:hypothetical protein
MLRNQEQGVAPAGRETTPALPASIMITAISNERQGCAISGATSPPGVSARTASLRAGSEGYNDIDRLPGPRQLPCAYSNTCIRDIGTRVKAAWPMTADEQRPFAYFQQHPIVSLTALFELPLWQRHALQMCHADQAIFHAVTMLSAAHQSSELKHMQRVQGTSVHRAYCFSLQQSSRAMRLLSQRLASQDPELRHVVLLCSLLFGLSDVLLDRHESAWTHFLSGLRILKEIEHHPYLISKAEPSLVAVYRRISLQAALYSTKISWADVPPSPVPTYVPPPPPDDALKASVCPFSSLAQMQSVLLRLLDTRIPLIATGLGLSGYDFVATTIPCISRNPASSAHSLSSFRNSSSSANRTHPPSPRINRARLTSSISSS